MAEPNTAQGRGTGPDRGPSRSGDAAVRFAERSERELFWLVDPDFAAPLEALGWPGAAAVEAALANPRSTGRAATAVLALPDRQERVHIRPVRHGGALGWLWRDAIWGTARPARELRVTARLRAAGAPVPRPVLVAAHPRVGPLWTAVVGTLHVEAARDGVVWLATRPERSALLRGARAAGAAIRRFHDAGGRHADLHLKNLLFREEADESGAPVRTEVWVIDLDGARDGAPPDPARRLRELMRLLRSLHKRGLADDTGPRAVAAAFSAYCRGDRALRRALLAHLPRERRRFARHAWAYRG